MQTAREITVVVIGGHVHQFLPTSHDLLHLPTAFDGEPQFRMPGLRLHVDPLRSFFHLFQTEECSFPSARTDVTDFFPRFRALEMGIPEWPCPALHRSSPINHAFSTARIEKRAIPVGKLGQTKSAADKTGMKQPNFTNWLSEILRDFQQFFIRDPNDPRCPRAAVAALGTGELQSAFVPGAALFCWIDCVPVGCFCAGRFAAGCSVY